jgi:P27 family predicted phage terminase small subunit
MDTKIKNKTYNSADYKALTDPERTVFRNVVNTLLERGIFNPSDVPVIAAYARNVVLARTAARDIERLGTVITFKDRGFTKYKTNPAVDIMNKAQAAYEATAIRLGLTPTGRRRLKGEEVPPKSELDEFMEGLDGGDKK